MRQQFQDKPVVVMDGAPPLEYVCSLNTKARALGISFGMTRVEVDTFPEAVTLSRSRESEKTARFLLLECAGTFSPRVENRSDDRAFLCGIDIQGTSGLFGPSEVLAQKLLKCVAALGISARIIVSTNFHTAACLAIGLSPRTPIKVVTGGEEASALAELSVAVLDLTKIQAETFALWGIETLGMLAALPQKHLIARMGQDGRRLWQLARGELPHLFRPVEESLTLKERIELDSPVEALDSLLFVIGVLLDRLIVRAREHILALATATASLSLERGGTHIRTVRPALPSNDKAIWIKLLHLDLESHPPSTPVLAVTLQAEHGCTSKQQLGLFAPQVPESSRLDVTLARIRAAVGEANVGRAVLRDTNHPDGFRLEPFALPTGQAPNAEAVPLRPAMRRVRPAHPIAVTVQSESPKAFFFRGKWYAVEHAYGPWETSGEWWAATQWESENWDLVARTQDGTTLCCRLEHDQTKGDWRMVALYD
jgi:protein ImuB